MISALSVGGPAVSDSVPFPVGGAASRRLVAAFTAAALLPPLLALWVLWGAPIGELDAPRAALAGRDFTAFWAAGRLALGHASEWLPDPTWFTHAMRDLLGQALPEQMWPYPPTILLLAAPFGALPFSVGLAAYTAISALLLWLALCRIEPHPLRRAALVLSPACINCALAGQNGMLLTACILSGLTGLRSGPRFAGVLLALATLKPQFSILLPVALVAGRHGRTLATMLVTAALLILVSLAWLGLAPWSSYLTVGHETISAALSQPWTGSSGQKIFVSPFMCARALGAGRAFATTLQCVVTGLCAVLTWRAWQRTQGANNARIALTLCLTLLASPWTHSYDEVALACAVILLVRRTARLDLAILGLAWMLPGLIISPPAITLQCASISGVAWIAWRRMADSYELQNSEPSLCAA